MPRQPRPDVAGGIHHLYNRRQDGRTLFFHDRDRLRFLADLQDLRAKQRWVILAYCLMGNHFHVLVETPEATLGAGMHRLGMQLAEAVKPHRAEPGHVFQGRYGSRLVESDAHFVHLHRYVALNPVTAGLCADPADWPWSSHRTLLTGVPDGLVSVERVQALLASCGGEPATRYPRLFDQDGPFGPWSNATSANLPRPTIAELVRLHGLTEGMREARWRYAYRVAEIAAEVGLSESTVSNRTRRTA